MVVLDFFCGKKKIIILSKKLAYILLKGVYAMNKKFTITGLLISIAISLGVGVLSGLLTLGSFDTYSNLQQPALAPPGWLFPVVWTVLYILMGISAYIIYKSDSKDCMNCPFKEKCTKSKYKQILRHVWEGYKEMINDYRHREDVKEIYKQRPQHIERVFADGKTKYGLRKTYFRGKERVHRELTLLYACMNLKKLAGIKQKRELRTA